MARSLVTVTLSSASLLLLAAGCHAAALSVDVVDAAGQPLADAAVYAEPASGPQHAKPGKTMEIEQKGRKFIPTVTVIQAGTSISFPNNDSVRHHVYSFSPAKVFELKLYSGEPANPVYFDKTGTVVIGCNIHDQMAAWIHVVPTPWFAKTDAGGKARLDGLPPGRYQVKAWHFGLPQGAQIPEQTVTVAGSDANAAFTVNVNTRPSGT